MQLLRRGKREDEKDLLPITRKIGACEKEAKVGSKRNCKEQINQGLNVKDTNLLLASIALLTADYKGDENLRRT